MTPYVQIPSVAGSSMLDSLKNPDVVLVVVTSTTGQHALLLRLMKQ